MDAPKRNFQQSNNIFWYFYFGIIYHICICPSSNAVIEYELRQVANPPKNII